MVKLGAKEVLSKVLEDLILDVGCCYESWKYFMGNYSGTDASANFARVAFLENACCDAETGASCSNTLQGPCGLYSHKVGVFFLSFCRFRTGLCGREALLMIAGCLQCVCISAACAGVEVGVRVNSVGLWGAGSLPKIRMPGRSGTLT